MSGEKLGKRVEGEVHLSLKMIHLPVSEKRHVIITKDKVAGPKVSFIRRFHCIVQSGLGVYMYKPHYN